jgi:DNA-binding Lrp family transcriptional regulator
MCPTHVQIGKTTHMSKLLSFVDIFVESPEMDNVLEALGKLENLEELYEVTGEFDIVTLVSAADIEEFREVLKNKIMKIKGVKSTVSSIVLKAHKGPKCEENNSIAPTTLTT